MNFLEELVAEWYSYQGYLITTNRKFGRRPNGGYEGEIDVLAWGPRERRLIHIECSTDADRLVGRVRRFQRKFYTASQHYKEILDIDFHSVRQLAIVGFSSTRIDFGDGIVHQTVPELIKEIHACVSEKDPMSRAVSEKMPLLRALQYGAWFAPGKEVANIQLARRPACLCGCGGYPKGKTSRFLPGHDSRRTARGA